MEDESLNYDELIKALRCTENGKDCDSGCPYHTKYTCDPERLMKDAADAIEELFGKVEQLPRWISVKEQLPEKHRAHYLCYLDDDSVAVCYWSNVTLKGSTEWEWHNPNWKEVTHFMPLPTPPKEDEA